MFIFCQFPIAVLRCCCLFRDFHHIFAFLIYISLSLVSFICFYFGPLLSLLSLSVYLLFLLLFAKFTCWNYSTLGSVWKNNLVCFWKILFTQVSFEMSDVLRLQWQRYKIVNDPLAIIKFALITAITAAYSIVSCLLSIICCFLSSICRRMHFSTFLARIFLLYSYRFYLFIPMSLHCIVLQRRKSAVPRTSFRQSPFCCKWIRRALLFLLHCISLRYVTHRNITLRRFVQMAKSTTHALRI